MDCLDCNGKAGWWEDYGTCELYWEDCPFCDNGQIPFMEWFSRKLWGEWLPVRFVEWYADKFYPLDTESKGV